MAVKIMVNSGLGRKLKAMVADTPHLALVQIQEQCTSLFRSTVLAKSFPKTALAEA